MGKPMNIVYITIPLFILVKICMRTQYWFRPENPVRAEQVVQEA